MNDINNLYARFGLNDTNNYGTQFGVNDTSNRGPQFGVNDINNLGERFGVNDINNYGAQFGVNNTTNHGTQFGINNTNNHDGSHIGTFNSPSTNASQNLYSEIQEHIGIEFNKKSPHNGTNVGFNSSNINPSFYPQDEACGTNNETNVLQQGLLSNFGLYRNPNRNTSNLIRNHKYFTQEQGSKFEGIFKEHALGFNINSQRSSNPTINLHCIPQQQGSIPNLDIQKIYHSTFNPQGQNYFSCYFHLETPNALSKALNFFARKFFKSNFSLNYK